MIPLTSLIVAMVGGLYVSGAETLWPITLTSLADAFGKADTALVLVCASAFAGIIALLFNVRLPDATTRVTTVSSRPAMASPGGCACLRAWS